MGNQAGRWSRLWSKRKRLEKWKGLWDEQYGLPWAGQMLINPVSLQCQTAVNRGEKPCLTFEVLPVLTSKAPPLHMGHPQTPQILTALSLAQLSGR